MLCLKQILRNQQEQKLIQRQLSDGAKWIWRIASERFPDAIQIIDLYHAREHYWKVAKDFFEKDKAKMLKWANKRKYWRSIPITN